MRGPMLTGIVPLLAVTTATSADVLHDNGKPDNINGYSNATENVFGARRGLLDDFVVPDGERWTLEGLRWNNLWMFAPAGTGAEIVLWSDAGGIPGAPLQPIGVTSYSETVTGRTFFSHEEVISWAEFEPVVLDEGHYWIEVAMAGPENNFWLTASPVQHGECWVNYDDFNGLESGTDQFGVPSDLAWWLEGTSEGTGVWACCFDNGDCLELTDLACAAQGGIFLGSGARCELQICGAPGACCLPSNDCSLITEIFCTDADGTFGGIDAQCGDIQCSVCATFLPETHYVVGGEPEDAALADLDGDLDLDLITGNDTGTIRTLRNQGDGSFVPLGINDYFHSDFDVGDVDGDGDIDVVAGTINGPEIRTFLNNGNGLFTLSLSYAVHFPGVVALGDLDGDDDLDVVTASYARADIGVLLNDGSGQYGVPEFYPRPANSSDIELGDVDGDLDVDVVVPGSALRIYLNEGDGTLAPYVSYSSGGWIRRAALIDLDGDGDLDVAAANRNEDPAKALSVLFNDGNGVFTFDANYGAAGREPEGLAAADLDGDAAPDLVVANLEDNSLSVLINEGDGTFGPAVQHTVGTWPRSPALGDLDGDGDTDIAVPNQLTDDVSILRNDCPFCPADLDGNGAVDFGDILAILAAWGETGIRREDLDRSGVVNFGDLLVLLAAWGPCLEM